MHPRWRSPRTWLAIVAGAAVVTVVVADLGRRKSPGALTGLHGVTADLDGHFDCSKCHGGWTRTMTQACVACHEEIGADIELKRGLHGKVERARTQCAACHSEHHGRDFPMVNANSFAAAGEKHADHFDHRLVGWGMDGKHLEKRCVDCHKQIEADPLEKGARRYGGLTQECTSCHEDPHRGAMALRCSDCHDQTDWKHLAYPDHAKHFELVGPHAAPACRDCHGKDGERSLERAGRSPERPSRDCAACHESPHEKKFVTALAFYAQTTPGATCGACHRPDQMKWRDPALTTTPEQHARTGFLLDAPHQKAACGQCHDPKLATFRERYPGRAADGCAGCHADVHGGQFSTGPFAKGGCISCHDRTRWEPHAFTVEKHALALLPLDGAHAKAKCNDCHRDPPVAKGQDPKQVPRAFRGTPDACDACHSDVHAGVFDAIAKRKEKVAHGICARCHDAAGFTRLPAPFDHQAWTGFPLEGAHETTACETCHPRAKKPDAKRRSFGRAAAKFGTWRGCFTCHADPHGAVFERPGLPAEVEQRRDCDRCHDASSFRSIRKTFEHGAWTGFPLADGHASIGCAACHAPLPSPDATGRTSARAAGPHCADCHEDPHGGQFLKGVVNDCEACHRSAANFSVLVFKHNVQSRFKLDETHAAVACDGCHKPFVRNGATIVRYRPLGLECADCHTAPSDPLRKRKGKQG